MQAMTDVCLGLSTIDGKTARGMSLAQISSSKRFLKTLHPNDNVFSDVGFAFEEDPVCDPVGYDTMHNRQ